MTSYHRVVAVTKYGAWALGRRHDGSTSGRGGKLPGTILVQGIGIGTKFIVHTRLL